MRLPGAPSWATKKKRGVRAGSESQVHSAGRLFVGSCAKAMPGAPAYAKVLTGDSVKDFYRRAVGPVTVLAAVVYALAGVPASNPLFLFYVANHRKELDACSRHLSRYLAVVFFAACSGLPMAPAEQWRQYRLVNQDSTERAALETLCFYNDSQTGICSISAVIRAINNALRIVLTPVEIMHIFPEKLNSNGLQSIDKDALKAALDAHGVTVEPLRLIFERVYRTEYAQRRAEIDTICGQQVDLEGRLKAIRKGQKVEKLERKPEARKRGSGRHKPKPKAARAARQQRAALQLQRAASLAPQDPGTDSEAEDDCGYATEEEDAMAPAATVTEEAAEDAGWCLALLNTEASLLPPAECEAMRRLIESLELRPLFDTHICGVKAPEFITPPFLRKRGREAQLQQQQQAAAALAASEVSGARVVGFEMMYAPPGAAPRVLFACIGELLLAADGCGERHANLSYAEGDRTVLPAVTPRSVPSAIFRACMLTMMAKLLRGGAAQLWLSACSPDWLWCEKTRTVYPDHFLVASRGRQYGIAVPSSVKPAQMKAMAAAAKEQQDKVLVSKVYTALFAHGEMHGILAPGSGKWAATPGAGAAVPPFVDDVYSKRLLYPNGRDHKPVPEGSFQPSFLDAELAESNKGAQMFWARLKQPDELSRLAAQLALQLDRKIPVPLAKHYKWRATEFENIKDRALKETAVPENFQTLGQLARFKLRDKYLEMQTNNLNF